MKKMGIGIICGQEGAMHEEGNADGDEVDVESTNGEKRRDRNLQRWDTDELFLSFSNGSRRKKAGNCFILSKEWGAAFERGGRQVKRHSDRLVTIRLPMKNGRNLYLVNAHAPDSGKTKAVRDAFQARETSDCTRKDKARRRIGNAGGLQCINGCQNRCG